MLVQVKYVDNRYDYVQDKTLDLYIESKKITGFKRSTGWVRIGIDPIRKAKRDLTQNSTSSSSR